MKLEKTLTAALLVLIFLCPFIGYGISNTNISTQVSIDFIESDSFTDIQNGPIRSTRRESYILKTIKKNMANEAYRYLPNGYSLQVRITNIDLAGDRSPISSKHGEYRVFRATHPPRIAFDYAVLDTSGNVISTGSERLTDLAYRNNLKVAISSDKTAAYVNDLVSSWVHRDLRRMVNNR